MRQRHQQLTHAADGHLGQAAVRLQGHRLGALQLLLLPVWSQTGRERRGDGETESREGKGGRDGRVKRGREDSVRGMGRGGESRDRETQESQRWEESKREKTERGRKTET